MNAHLARMESALIAQVSYAQLSCLHLARIEYTARINTNTQLYRNTRMNTNNWLYWTYGYKYSALIGEGVHRNLFSDNSKQLKYLPLLHDRNTTNWLSGVQWFLLITKCILQFQQKGLVQDVRTWGRCAEHVGAGASRSAGSSPRHPKKLASIVGKTWGEEDAFVLFLLDQVRSLPCLVSQ